MAFQLMYLPAPAVVLTASVTFRPGTPEEAPVNGLEAKAAPERVAPLQTAVMIATWLASVAPVPPVFEKSYPAESS